MQFPSSVSTCIPAKAQLLFILWLNGSYLHKIHQELKNFYQLEKNTYAYMINSWWNYHWLGQSDRKKAGMKTGYHYNFVFRKNKWEVWGVISGAERLNIWQLLCKGIEKSQRYMELASQTEKKCQTWTLKMWGVDKQHVSYEKKTPND